MLKFLNWLFNVRLVAIIFDEDDGHAYQLTRPYGVGFGESLSWKTLHLIKEDRK